VRVGPMHLNKRNGRIGRPKLARKPPQAGGKPHLVRPSVTTHQTKRQRTGTEAKTAGGGVQRKGLCEKNNLNSGGGCGVGTEKGKEHVKCPGGPGKGQSNLVSPTKICNRTRKAVGGERSNAGTPGEQKPCY